MIKTLTCIECPMGCEIEVTLNDGKIEKIQGNSCPRGKLYAENEVVCPKRVLTSTVRSEKGEMIPVKTDRPIRKEAIFDVMKKINSIRCAVDVKCGDVIAKNICDDANLVVSGNL